MAAVKGTYQVCPGDTPTYSYTFECSGTRCSVLEKLPSAHCTTVSSSTLRCSNDVMCSGPSNYANQFSYQLNAQGRLVRRTSNVTLWGGFGYVLTSNGSQHGITMQPWQIQNGKPTFLSGPKSDAKGLFPDEPLPPSASPPLASGGIFQVARPLRLSGVCILLLLMLALPLAQAIAADAFHPGGLPLQPRDSKVEAVIDATSKLTWDVMIENLKTVLTDTEADEETTTLSAQLLDSLCSVGAGKLIQEGMFKSTVGQFNKICTEIAEAAMAGRPQVVASAEAAAEVAAEEAGLAAAEALEREALLVPMAAMAATVLFCDYATSVIFPWTEDLSNYLCTGKWPCKADILNDANNCGACGNKCPSNQCIHGYCLSDGCNADHYAGNTFSGCGDGSRCMCAYSETDGSFCVNADKGPCLAVGAVSDSCFRHEDCPVGQICAASPRCNTRVCLGNAICQLQLPRPGGSAVLPKPATPSKSSATPKTSITKPPAATTSKTSTAAPKSSTTSPAVTLEPWVFRTTSSAAGDAYSETPAHLASVTSSYFIKDASGRATVNTVCTTFFNTGITPGRHTSTSGLMDGLAKGDVVYFGYDDGTVAHDSCCIDVYANEECTGTGAAAVKSVCAAGSFTLGFFAASWRVRGCKMLV